MFLIESGSSRLKGAIERNAQPYFERGYNAVIEQRPLRSFEESVDIIKPKLLEHGLDEYLAEGFACIFAWAYIAGIVAAARLVAPDLVAQFAPFLECCEQSWIAANRERTERKREVLA